MTLWIELHQLLRCYFKFDFCFCFWGMAVKCGSTRGSWSYQGQGPLRGVKVFQGSPHNPHSKQLRCFEPRVTCCCGLTQIFPYAILLGSHLTNTPNYAAEHFCCPWVLLRSFYQTDSMHHIDIRLSINPKTTLGIKMDSIYIHIFLTVKLLPFIKIHF